MSRRKFQVGDRVKVKDVKSEVIRGRTGTVVRAHMDGYEVRVDAREGSKYPEQTYMVNSRNLEAAE